MDLVMMRGRDAVCDSLEVAEHFGKEHRNIIQAIDNLTAENSAVKKKFTVSTYKAENGHIYRRYYMNRDGFSLLVMGFNGKEALDWKMKYIEAFNRMEQLLAQKQTEVYKDTRAYQKAIRKQTQSRLWWTTPRGRGAGTQQGIIPACQSLQIKPQVLKTGIWQP